MNWLENITRLIQLKTRYFFAAWIFGTLLIFLPAPIKEQMGVVIPESVRPWIGFTTLATFVLWLTLLVTHGFSAFKRWLAVRRNRAEILDQLETLSGRERDIFLQCLSLNQRTINRNIIDSAANSLKSKHLLLMASQGSMVAMPYTIPKFVWDYVKGNEIRLFPELHDQDAMQAYEERQRHGWMAG